MSDDICPACAGKRVFNYYNTPAVCAECSDDMGAEEAKKIMEGNNRGEIAMKTFEQWYADQPAAVKTSAYHLGHMAYGYVLGEYVLLKQENEALKSRIREMEKVMYDGINQ